MEIKQDIDIEHLLEWELSRISNERYLKIALVGLYWAPDYFWYVPASSSGKHHPKSSLGIGGLFRHTKAGFRFAELLFENTGLYPFSEEEKDIIRVALLLHDTQKQGTETSVGHTAPDHPLLVRKVVTPQIPTPLLEKWDRVCHHIESHSGQWTKDKEGNEILPLPTSSTAQFVHLCDYLASRNIIEIDILDRTYQNKKEEEPATEKQLEYIGHLYREITEKPELQGTDIPHVGVALNTLTKKSASEIITDYRKLLGKD